MPFRILQPSFQSLYVETLVNGHPIGKATAFVGQANLGKAFLITNRHVVTGRNQDTGTPLHSGCGIPDTLRVHHNAHELGTFIQVDIPLLAGGPLWIEHPSLGEKADIVALAINEVPTIKLYPYFVKRDADGRLEPAHRVNVVGFPFGEKTAQSFAVWSTGFVASEPDIDHGGRPIFLIDCRTREGQSGSPVITSRLSQGYLSYDDGSTVGEFSPELLGVYSGRINPESDLGIVWKASAVVDLLIYASSI